MQYSIQTNPGKRKDNQDFTGTFFNQENVLLSILCDGLGGHRAGDIASEMAVSQIGNAWEQTTFTSSDQYLIQNWLNHRINQENNRIYEASQTYIDLEGMGTTLVACVILNDSLLFANVGDSRGYVFKDEHMHLITEDHSFVSELQRRGELSPDEAKNHINRNALTRSLGVDSPVEIDFFSIEKKNIKMILLNSDGVSNTLTEEEMSLILKEQKSVEQKAKALIHLSVEKEASDNVTVNVIDLETDNQSKAVNRDE